MRFEMQDSQTQTQKSCHEPHGLKAVAIQFLAWQPVCCSWLIVKVERKFTSVRVYASLNLRSHKRK